MPYSIHQREGSGGGRRVTALTIVIANPASWAEARAGESIGGVTITSGRPGRR